MPRARWRGASRATFARLIELLTEATIAHLEAQISAGADVVQLFDSWAGVLPEPEFERWCHSTARRDRAPPQALAPDVPVIAFPRGAGALCGRLAEAAPLDGLSLDTAVPIGELRRALPKICLQGNLDPIALLAGGPRLLREAERIVAGLGSGPFIFNLGHGVLPETDPDAGRGAGRARALPLPLPR